MDIETILKTASIYTTLLLSTSTKVYTRQQEDEIYISNTFGGRREEQIIHQLMKQAPSNSIFYLEGDFGICSCLIFIEDHMLMREFKLKARTVSSKEDARKISVAAIAQVCKLVRDQTGAKYSPTIRDALDYIHSNLSFPFTVSDIAEKVHMTDSAFTRKFRQELNTTPTEYITRERMRQAADLLVFTNLDIRHICTQVGMMDANYFARCFKREYGVSPTVYRKNGYKK